MLGTSRKVVFIMGPGHCGSTLLDLILGSHSTAFSLGELRRIGSLLDSSGGKVRICGVCEDDCNFWNHQASLPLLRVLFSGRGIFNRSVAKSLRYVLNSYHVLFRWTGASVLVDSSKQPQWIKNQMSPGYTWRNVKPYLVYICRDGRAVVNSYLRKYPDRGIMNIAGGWKRQIIAMNTFYDQFPSERRIKIKYEALATEPDKVIRLLTDALGMDYEPDMLRYWVHDHHHLFGNGGTRFLIYKYRRQFSEESEGLVKKIEHSKRFYSSDYYDQVEVAIKLDERWRKELSQDDLRVFNEVTGELNRDFAHVRAMER